MSSAACGSEMHAEVMWVVLRAAASLVECVTSRHFRPHTAAARAWAAGLQATKQGRDTSIKKERQKQLLKF